MLRDFIPKADFFIKTEKSSLSPIGVADDGSVYAAPAKKESRKKRKSRKLEFLTSLVDTLMASIMEFSAKQRRQNQHELEKLQNLLKEEQDKNYRAHASLK